MTEFTLLQLLGELPEATIREAQPALPERTAKPT